MNQYLNQGLRPKINKPKAPQAPMPARAGASLLNSSPEFEQFNQDMVMKEYEKAERLLNTPSIVMPGLTTSVEKDRQLNTACASSLEGGLMKTFTFLRADDGGGTRGSAFGLSESEYLSEIDPWFRRVEATLQTVQSQIEDKTFNIHSFLPTVQRLITDLSAPARHDLVNQAAHYVMEGLTQGVKSFYEREGLSSPDNIIAFLTNVGVYTALNDLVEGGIDKTNDSHTKLLMAAMDLYHMGFAHYRINPSDYIRKIGNTLRSYTAMSVPQNALMDTLHIYSKDGEIEKNSTNSKKLQNHIDLLEGHIKHGTHENPATTPPTPATFTSEFITAKTELVTTEAEMKSFKRSIDNLIDKLNHTGLLTPSLNVDDFYEDKTVSLMCMDHPDYKSAKLYTYQEYKFDTPEEFMQIVDRYRDTVKSRLTHPPKLSADEMTMSICQEMFDSSFPGNPKAVSIAASSRMLNYELQAKMRKNVEVYGSDSHNIEIRNLDAKALTFNESLDYAIQEVVSKHPDVNSEALRTALSANNIDQFDNLLRDSHRFISANVLCEVIAVLQSIYSGDRKSQDEHGKDCVFGIASADYFKLQRQISIMTQGYSNFHAVRAISSMGNFNSMTKAERFSSLLQAQSIEVSRFEDTTAILARRASKSDTLRQIVESNTAYSSSLVSRMPAKEYQRLLHQRGLLPGRLGTYSVDAYRRKRVMHGITKVSNVGWKYAIKPLGKAIGFLPVYLPYKALNWITGQRLEKYGKGAYTGIKNYFKS